MTGTPGSGYYCGQLKKGTKERDSRTQRGGRRTRKEQLKKDNQCQMHRRSSIIFPCLSSIQTQGKLSLWDPFSGVWKRPVCVPGLSSDCVHTTEPLPHEDSPQASAKPSPIHLLVAECALRGQAPEGSWEAVGALAPCCAWAWTQHPSFLVYRVWPLTLRSAPFCFPISLPSSLPALP